MTSPSPGRLLISHITLRGPELCQLYECVARMPGITYAQLCTAIGLQASGGADPFGLNEAALREALHFLLVARLVEQEGSVRQKACFRPTQRLTEVSMDPSSALTVLNAIMLHPEVRQRAISAVHQQLVRRDMLALSVTTLRSEVERGPLREAFAWTGEKLGFWARLCEHLGLIRNMARDGQLVLVPTLELISEALRACMLIQSKQRTMSLEACLRLVDESYFACFTERGTIHRGLTQTLIALHSIGAVHLSHTSDAPRSLLLGEWRVSNISLP